MFLIARDVSFGGSSSDVFMILIYLSVVQPTPPNSPTSLNFEMRAELLTCVTLHSAAGGEHCFTSLTALQYCAFLI